MTESTSIGATYMPMEFRQALAQGRTLRESTKGAAFFSDFSGFTVLAGALNARFGTTRGAEQLADLLRGAFEGIVAAIHDYRGSVIGFSGDAVTVWFDDDCGTELPAAVRAVAAALAVHDFVATLPEFHISDSQKLSIGIKVSITAGPAWRYVVGDPAVQRMAVFAGETLQRLSMADNLANAGDLILDHNSYADCERLLSASAVSRTKNLGEFMLLDACELDVNPCPWPNVAPPEAKHIQPWLLADVVKHLRNGATGFLGAFKPIVAIFLKFEGIDYDHEPDAGAQLNVLISRIQQIATDYGGHLVDVTIGDKGSYVFVALGALQTHENDAARAIAAVLQLRRAGAGIQQLRDAAIGVARGNVYVGEYGCSERRTFGIVGRDIIVAARLMSLADIQQTLVTPDIVELTRSQFEFDHHTTVALKGIDEPMPVFQLGNQSDNSASSPISALSTDRLFGRERECETIDRMIAEAENQESNTLIMEGEPGIGKSRLLEYLLQRGILRGLKVLVGAADAIGSTSRYHAWKGVFRELLLISKSENGEEHAELARAYVETNLPRLTHLLPLLNDVIGVDIDDNELTRNMLGKVREDNTSDLLIQILADHARQEPAVIVLEDGHWFDSASAALLHRAVDELNSTLIVVTRRPLSEAYAANTIYKLESGQTHVLSLRPLSAKAVELLIGDVLQVDTVPPELLEFVFDKAQGSPFFSRELTIALRVAKVIDVNSGRCALAEGVTGLEEADFPFTIQGTIGSRIDHLPQAQQLALKVASVVGREFDYQIVHEMLPSDDDKRELKNSLLQLDKADLIENADSVTERKYVFRHVLTQEVAYGMLLHRQRVLLHEQAARWYETPDHDSVQRNLPLLAHHWSRAALERPGDEASGGRAVLYLAEAAEQSIGNNANREAVQFINNAIEIDDQLAVKTRTIPLQRAGWFATLAHAYHALGDEAQCRVAGETGLQCAGAPLPGKIMSLMLATLAQVLRQAAHRLFRLDINKAKQPTDVTESFIAQCILYRNLSRALWGSNESLLMMYVNFKNLNISERLGPSPELAVIYSHMVMTLSVFQLPKWGNWYQRRSLEIARESNDIGALATVLISLGVNAVGTANWREASQVLEECLELCSRLGDTKQWAEAASLQGDAALLTGDFDKGLASYLDIYGRSERKGSLGHMGLSLRTQAMIALQEGDLVEAGKLLTKAEHILDDTTEKLIQIDVYGLQALVEYKKNAVPEAYGYLQRCISLIEETMPPIAYPRLFGLRAASRVVLGLLEQGDSCADLPADSKDLKVLAEKMRGNLNAYQRVFSIGEPAAKIHSATLHWLRGNSTAASKEINKAIAAAQRLEMQPELVEAEALAARFARDDN